MIAEKIQEIFENIAMNEKQIFALRASNDEQKKEIEKFKILKDRLQKIQQIQYFENLSSPEKIFNLANRYRLIDLLDVLTTMGNINLTFDSSAMPIMNLSVYQGLFLLFGDELQSNRKPEQAITEAAEPSDHDGEE